MERYKERRIENIERMRCAICGKRPLDIPYSHYYCRVCSKKNRENVARYTRLKKNGWALPESASTG